jgi:mannose-1-phosphate guanylyltransferase
VGRVAPLAPYDRIFVVTGTAHAASVARQLPDLPESNILVEPLPRESCAAIGLAAAIIARRDPEAIMGSFAADHLVADVGAFAEVVRAAVDGAESGLLMTVGITPTRAETGYGYLGCGEPIGEGPVRMVGEFKEKPARDVAESYVAAGYLWNASMFVWRVDLFLSELARQQPALHDGLVEIATVWDSPGDRERALAEVWPGLPKIAVDYAVMEGAATAGLVGTVPGAFGWHDVGDFGTVGDVLPADESGNVVVGLDKPLVLMRESANNVIVSQSGRLVAALGVDDLIVVDTPDALMICPRARAQGVKEIVDELKARDEIRYI